MSFQFLLLLFLASGFGLTLIKMQTAREL